MKHDQLPEHWKNRVAELARELSDGRYERLGAEAFKQEAVRVRFPDGSSALFLYAFALTDEERRELAVFTEHCGYHVFPLEDTTVDTHPLDSVRGTTSEVPPGKESVVSLREVTKENLLPVLRLKVTPRQERFVAPNSISIAEAHFDPEIAWFRAIYADETPVGFLMLEDRPDRPSYFLWRFMIDHRFQGFGFGARALELLADHVRTRPGATILSTSCVPGEGGPGPFYEKAGFSYTGDMDGIELIMQRPL